MILLRTSSKKRCWSKDRQNGPVQKIPEARIAHSSAQMTQSSASEAIKTKQRGLPKPTEKCQTNSRWLHHALQTKAKAQACFLGPKRSPQPCKNKKNARDIIEKHVISVLAQKVTEKNIKCTLGTSQNQP